MKKKQRYTAEFKAEAVRLAKRKDRSIAGVARSLGISATLLRYWMDQQTPAPSAYEGPRSESLEAENQRLRRVVARLEEERDILKKAAAYFANASR